MLFHSKKNQSLIKNVLCSGMVSLALFASQSVLAGTDATVDYADIENPWVDFVGDNVDWTEYGESSVYYNGVAYPFFTKVKGEGVDVIGDWISGSFFENATNRKRYVQHLLNEFDLPTFNAYTGWNFSESQVNVAQILLYNDAAFTMDKTAVWIEKQYQDGTKEMQIYESGTDIVEEELREVMHLLRPSVLRLRVGYKAKGELSFFGGNDWKKCDWVDIDDLTAVVYKATGALYNKKCSVEFKDTSKF